jgi:predicted P-loop ATPase
MTDSISNDNIINQLLEMQKAQMEQQRLQQQQIQGILAPDKDKKKKKEKINNTLKVLSSPIFKNVIKKNRMSAEIVYGATPPFPSAHGDWKGRVISGEDINYWIAYFETVEGYSLTDKQMWSVIQTTANKPGNTFHPLQEYLDGLVWDGVPRLEDVLEKYFGVDYRDANHRRVVNLQWIAWNMGLIKRAYEPGCVFANIFVLDGRQYLGKSLGFKAYIGEQFFCDTPLDLTNKDAYLNIRNVWGYEMSELEGANKAESTRLKNFLSSTHDKFRVPYAILAITEPRTTVFCGTTNETQYIRDNIGNRRIWTATVTRLVDQSGIKENRDQFLAEAVHLYRSGKPCWLSDADNTAVMRENEVKCVVDPMFRNIRMWLDQPHTFMDGKHECTNNMWEFEIDDVLASLGLKRSVDQISIATMTRTGQALSRYGMEKFERNGGFYYRPRDFTKYNRVSVADPYNPAKIEGWYYVKP